MLDIATHSMRFLNIQTKLMHVFLHRSRAAAEQYTNELQANGVRLRELLLTPMTPQEYALGSYGYATDFWERTLLFWDTIRRRGNQFIERELAGKPPVLHFEYQMVLDGRSFERSVNYALVRIIPPSGVNVDDQRRPYVILDPRAGHGPGIGGFKDDSEVGVALRAGHPVYFVIFFPEPEPDQTLLDVCAAEQRFVSRVRELHPDSPKPAIVGNCQGGWAAMMLVASSPQDTGPVVINGAPMSYWGGAWQEGEGNNPMRYLGGLLGGTWLGSFAADLGNGPFDGAHIVRNFESLDPANTWWKKYYNVFEKADTEPARFLDFERWWGGYYLMSRGEIDWITQTLFVGGKLWTGGVQVNGKILDLREVRSPIVMFASMGDNITPPQQAFNWVADVYGSTEEIKAHGQVIVGLLHQTAGHLGLFVSGKVAKKEHAQLVSVLQSIEALPPGLYGMKINEKEGSGGAVEYEVSFVEHRLEELMPRLNRFQRADEKPFLAVAAISDFNQRAYELFVEPAVRAVVNEPAARLGRLFHPLRFQRWSLSDLNPWLWPLASAAESVKANRHPVPSTHPLRQVEKAAAEMVSATLDFYRDLRDAITEATFFAIYGNPFSLYLADRAAQGPALSPKEPQALPFVKAALESIEEGGYPAALARTAELLERRGGPVPLARVERKAQGIKDFADLLPDLPIHEWKMMRGEQDIIVRFEQERALATLPRLLSEPRDRERFLQVLDRVANDRQLSVEPPTQEQLEMLKRIKAALNAQAAA
jgi:pimeloyl-ACP methyl ester carboxylesterase